MNIQIDMKTALLMSAVMLVLLSLLASILPLVSLAAQREWKRKNGKA